MALLSLNRIAWTYHSDNHYTYRVAAQKAITDQAVLGGEAWNGTDWAKTGDVIKMRRTTVRSLALGVSRVVPVYDIEATIMTPGTNITLNHLADSSVFSSSGFPIGEVYKRHSVTQQAV